MTILITAVLKKSENIVFRKIENEYILVPIVASAADVESIFNLNETGAAVWERIDGTKRLSDIIEDIKGEYESEDSKIDNDVMVFVNGMVGSRDAGSLAHRQVAYQMSGNSPRWIRRVHQSSQPA